LQEKFRTYFRFYCVVTIDNKISVAQVDIVTFPPTTIYVTTGWYGTRNFLTVFKIQKFTDIVVITIYICIIIVIHN